MCNACGFYCCGWDGFEKCGCDHCPEPRCHDDACWTCGRSDCDGCDDDDDYEMEPEPLPAPQEQSQ